MTPEQLGAWSKDLRQRINDSGGMFLLTHVTTRVALLLQGQPIAFVAVAASTFSPTATGVVAVFTTELLAVVHLVNVAGQITQDGSPRGDVSVEVVPRRTLTRMTVEKADDEKNFNRLWMGSRPTWPQYGELRLSYPALADDVIVGRGPLRYAEDGEHSELDVFLPQLAADLAK